MVGEEMSKELESSLPVENVQALASNNPLVDESLQIPIIDMRKLMVEDDEMGKLHLACKEWGFFQLINHGVAEEVIEKMKVDLQEFFKLPLEEKNAYARLPNGMEGYGQPYIFGQGRKLDWGDMFMLGSLPASQRNMKFWPENPSSFRATLDKYSLELQKVSTCLVKLMAKNLGNNPKHLTDMFENGRQAVRMNYYPACVNGSNVMGITPHTDASGLTLLLQVNEVQGLQIKRNGKWIPITPIPGAFIVNIGDIIEVMSNGEYKSVEHKTVLNPEHERFSIAAFHFPNVKAMIGPLQDLVKENGAVYKTLSNDEFLGLFQKAKLDDGTGY
ncbi:S-norcoclaurine synthase 1 isoform X2 [Vitis vinifera]|uniref:S-norcoclaurine synthase 1 isoform X2 n=1 Tax=Vitis vinifera TaxID=29760 RepID=UPI00053FD1DD|nr:S-norcoclaurine synthase 1 isoform X2 [Vitis vinifera]|eukprot:XP_010664126.1 PREDICTED: S-norcoclaurine synthase 1 isoform X2 [Vitis vinifera]